MSVFSNVSRRQFITIATASAGAVLTKGCMGNPPGTATISRVSSGANPPVDLPPELMPEVKTVSLGYLPIVEAAPLIIAKAKGLFAKHGLPDVKIAKQANWGSARDNVKIGSTGGGIDGGQWQMPMPYLISEGIITDNTRVPMYVLAQLNTQGNGIAIAKKHWDNGLSVQIANQTAFFDKLKSEGLKFKAAYSFPKVNQEFWIRYWLAGNGIDPDAEVELLTVPTAQTVADMKRGAMDAFSTGDPWPYRIVADQIGFISVLTAEIWKNHPEEYLAIRQDWVDQYPKATKAVLKAVMEAQQWCDNFANRKELAAILAQREYFGVPENVLLDPLMGQYNLGERSIDDQSMAVLYWQDEKGSVSYPYQSHDLWFLTESVRWGFLPKDTLSKANDLIKRVNREDIWREAATELGVVAADIPTSTSRGIEAFFDGIQFDPENPQAYLDSLKIKRV